ncbi:DUF6328 family protein [Mycolicibacterium diernhoferi]|uniref:Sodium:proton antiporter n=1 Tax=Mycolicibacterium diernhoferi TaxID=1801 RepID=A0A2A7NSA2_9MYCO|nr:DUF6328 family protein [Mycolicibacterium diernhoferi]PEG53469.1 sodium:proton antiporter [Mycolicibacterium diernhoferi]QYL24150.1 sodium:proton antiporter [Mycolicibacterium diernhoferi]
MDRLEPDRRWNEKARHETSTQRLDRNWSSLLQELRVVQTGVQLLTGLLLTLPFHDGFEDLRAELRIVYLYTVACSIGATALLIAPIGIHRSMFRRHRLDVVVTTAHHLANAGILLLGLTLSGVMVLIFGAVLDLHAGIVAGLCTALGIVLCWLVLPVGLRALAGPPQSSQPADTDPDPAR